METSRLKIVEDFIDSNSELTQKDKQRVKDNIRKLFEQQMNIMVTGATGCGKSSTINALFDAEKAKVGTGCDPETMEITRFDLDNLIIWDTPGLGDGKERDDRHRKNIIKKLKERDSQGNLLIDLVLVILDGSSRDLGTSFELINEVIIPNLGDNKEDRILVAINQCDMAMKGRYWNDENHLPEPPLIDFLKEKVQSVQKRIYDSTAVEVEPIYYSAGFKEEGSPQEPSYNLNKLLYYIISKTPENKRVITFTSTNQQSLHQDSQLSSEPDYGTRTVDEVKKSAWEIIKEGAGKVLDTVLGPSRTVIGRVISRATGFSSSKCYITTATCEAFGKPDDCYELTMFRSFRDHWLVNEPDGKALIEQYYRTAPALVDMIEQKPNRIEIYKMLRDSYLSPCLYYIETKQYEACKEKYIAMVNYLSEEQAKLKQ